MSIKNFNQFIGESSKSTSKIKKTAGVAVVWQNQILLVHPTNASWRKPTLGIPKGGIEEGEEPLKAAIRELMEETGISAKVDQLDPEPLVSNLYKEDGTIKSQLIYFVMKIENLSDIGITTGTKVSQNSLQLEEIDWAGFIPIEDSYSKVHRSQLIILDRLR